MTDTAARDSGSPFWRFSLQFYRRPGVADACITLQEEAGVDVNLLLFLLWQATTLRQAGRADIERLDACLAPWRAMAVVPLRSLRRALKTPPDLLEPTVAEGFRSRIKALELEAERLQQEALYDLARAAPLGMAAASPVDAARANLAAYQAILPRPFPSEAVAAIMAAFTKSGARIGSGEGGGS
jgi:uncharacterized protein (TIGR02444 family)